MTRSELVEQVRAVRMQLIPLVAEAARQMSARSLAFCKDREQWTEEECALYAEWAGWPEAEVMGPLFEALKSLNRYARDR